MLKHFTLLMLLLTALAKLPALADTNALDEADSVKQVTYRIARILIPADSRHREANYDKFSPPDLYVKVFRNGNQIGKASDAVEGYDVSFSDQSKRNFYLIDENDAENIEYSIQVWDYDRLDPDDHVLSISGLKASDFAKPIRERLSPHDDSNRALIIYFHKVD